MLFPVSSAWAPSFVVKRRGLIHGANTDSKAKQANKGRCGWMGGGFSMGWLIHLALALHEQQKQKQSTGAQAARRMMVEVVSADEIRDGSPSKPRRASGSIDG
ncbi:uncharacterized protein TrAtP1_005753 [Trichoderma atroviride]|uniref:uncharacterized protein n=1 Tax=Hypocrea atroviridis TaxID=63577 RepID=UPI00332858AB|nr:hypothetical protein TrAtP1_005753 [Trichoderma atroviride]